MLAEIEPATELSGTMVGQLNTAPGGATNAVIRGPRHDHFLGAIVTRDNSTHSSSFEAQPARPVDPRIDPGHPVLEPKPVRWPEEHPLDHKMRVKAWTAAKTRRRLIPKHVREAVYERDGHKCAACGGAGRLSIDHIIPWSMGGADRPINLQTLCISCNSRKHDSMPGDA